MSSFIVITPYHHLIPLAWRLRHEGHQVELLILKRRYREAWDGRFDKIIKADTQHDNLSKERQGIMEAAKEIGATVVCDASRGGWSETFEGYDGYFGAGPSPEPLLSTVLLGGWFDGESFRNRHLLIQDVGLWPGGLGAREVAGLTLIHPERWPENFDALLEEVRPELKGQFRGLVRVGVSIDQAVKIETTGYSTGWSLLHSHAFMAGLDSLSAVLAGGPPLPEKRFTVVAPVSVPPWPRINNERAEQAEVMLPEEEEAAKLVRSSIYWHDVRVDGGKLMVAGVDGLVGVVHQNASQFELARSRVITYAGAVGLSEPQRRSDVGVLVPTILASLESVGLEV